MNEVTLGKIYDAYVNGQKGQVVENIDRFGVHDFFTLFFSFLVYEKFENNRTLALDFFKDISVTYHTFKVKEN